MNFLTYMRKSHQLPSLQAGEDIQNDSRDKSACGGLVQPVWAGTETETDTEPLEAASGFNDVQWSSEGA